VAAWLLLLAPCLAPPLLAGYAYTGFCHSVPQHSFLKELVYMLLLVFRLVPVAVVALKCLPRSVSREAVHCHRMLRSRHGPVLRPFRKHGRRGSRPSTGPGTWRGRPALRHALAHSRLLLRGELGAGLVAGALVFLLAFAEFEQASLLSITHWTVALFDAQAGGCRLAESLRLAAMPVACGLLVLVPALRILRGLRSAPAAHRPLPPPPHTAFWAWGYLALALFGGLLLPAAVVLRGTVEGLAAFFNGFSLQRELAVSLGVALAAAAGTYLAVGPATRIARGSRRRVAYGTLLVAACMPGLLGALVLALVIQYLFQLPGLSVFYDTPVPLLAGFVLYLFPFAALLSHVLEAGAFDAAGWTARLLGRSPHATVRRAGSGLLWRLHHRRRFWLFGLLFFLAYFDVSLSSILAPTGLPPAMARLYNFMHYGRSAVLSAMLCCTVLAAAAAMGGLYAAGREGVRRHG